MKQTSVPNTDNNSKSQLSKKSDGSNSSKWQVKSLVDIATISTGKRDANHATENGRYRFYTCAYDYLLCDTKRFQGECLILPGNGVNVGEVFYYEGDFDAYQRTYVISDIKIFPKYLHYHMMFHWKSLGTKKQYGSATNFIKIGNFQEYMVAYPPLAEQKAIVAILDQAFGEIEKVKANTEKNLNNAKELFQSYLQGVFENKGDDWEEKKLGEVCEVIAGQSPEGKYYNSEGKGLPFYQGKKEYGDKYIGDPRIWTTKITKSAEAGDILMSVRAPVGPVNFSTQKICIGRGLAAIRANQSIDREFLFNFLINHENGIEGNAGAVFNSINKTQIENIEIPLPPLSEQQTIVRQLDVLRAETQKLEAIYTQKLSDLEELKKSLLQKAFAGELVK